MPLRSHERLSQAFAYAPPISLAWSGFGASMQLSYLSWTPSAIVNTRIGGLKVPGAACPAGPSGTPMPGS